MTFRLCWITDPHLNFVDESDLLRLCDDIHESQPQAVVVTGDIGEAPSVGPLLERLDDALGLPLYFVLGNHDFYFGSIQRTRAAIANLRGRHERLHYLTDLRQPVRLGDWALVGHDGWADAREGDYLRSLVSMSDHYLIEEFQGLDKIDRWPLLHKLGDEAASHVRDQLTLACEVAKQVVLATHVPPFLGACWHEGRLSDEHWAPHFTCRAVGDAILDVMSAHRDNRLLVLCGHTHGAGEYGPLPNVEVLTGDAVYGAPEITRLLELS